MLIKHTLTLTVVYITNYPIENLKRGGSLAGEPSLPDDSRHKRDLNWFGNGSLVWWYR